MPQEIQVRPATNEDLDIIARLRAIGFGSNEAAIRASLENSPHSNYRQAVIAEIGGTPVGTAAVLSNQMWLSGVPIPFGAVASVTTHPDYRNRGVCTAMMGALLKKMSQDGVVISGLFPVAHNIYQKSHYAAAAVWHAYSIKPDNLHQFAEAERVRPFEMDDLSAVQSIYRGSQLSLADGRLTRPNSRWQQAVAEKYRTGNRQIVVYEGAEKVEGYLKYELTESQILRVSEIFVSDDAAYRGLWGYMATRPNIASIDYLAPADDSILHLLKMPGDSHGGNRGWVFDDIYHATSSFMLRVIDVVEALTARFYPHDMMGNRVFKIHDPDLPANSELVNFRIVDGRPDTLPVENNPVQVETDIATFSQVYCGFMSAETARRLGRLSADDETILWLDKAMKTSPLFIHKGDWF